MMAMWLDSVTRRNGTLLNAYAAEECAVSRSGSAVARRMGDQDRPSRRGNDRRRRVTFPRL